MAIPSFPSHDLAKLVLGYLAEEQLMTAYDEFLQASPYLDALRNEYDRIFMTSLKNILAEYRAVKIYVETCKPVSLRRMLFQCTNLLDTVKFLVSHIDLNKVNGQEVATDKKSSQPQNATTSSKLSVCEACRSLKLHSCNCKNKETKMTNSQSTTLDSCSLESSVEATALSDLPGNHVTTRRKNIKVLEKVTLTQSSLSSSNPNDLSSINDLKDDKNTHVLHTNTIETNSSLRLISAVKPIDTCESQEKLEEFNSILERVCSNNSTVDIRHTSEIADSIQCTKSSSSNFQDFATGVIGGEHVNTIVPDSSTSDNINMQGTLTKHFNIEPNLNDSGNSDHCNLLLKVGNVTNTLSGRSRNNNEMKRKYCRVKPNDTKIKIISDIKVDNKYGSNEPTGNKHSMPAVLKNATSTPLMQINGVVINGTSAYRHKSIGKNRSFTKDEIMSMPTFMVVPTSGSLPITSCCQTKTSKSCFSESMQPSKSPIQLLGPLVIDIATNPTNENTKVRKLPNVPSLSNEPTLIKTTDMLKNASVPKDTVSAVETSTPQILPPTRKSSSTPRRSSHIRVLDFTTPRRILHETINEKPENQNSDNTIEVILSRSPNIGFNDNETPKNLVSIEKNYEFGKAIKEKDNKMLQVLSKKSSWDADLRGRLVNEEIQNAGSCKKLKNNKLKGTRKKKISDATIKQENQNEEKSSKVKKKISPKTRKKNNKIKCNVEESEPVTNSSDTVHVAVKPTINIISKENWDTPAPVIENKHENQHIVNVEEGDTPEMDRIALQNAIGVKLNISELLETPYKQALYDIQMETPKFLGPDLPDDPMSDIKIMNIPTPRFLDTPKLVQATPSSFSSRPTDYSSGGSYYKPDDQDYLPIPDLRVTISSPKEDVDVVSSNQAEVPLKKSCRPVRQCTKNVSYYKHSNINSILNGAEDNADNTSSCSDPITLISPTEKKTERETHTKISKEKCPVERNSETKRRSNVNKKRKSPVKKVKSKPFMKIKPRRPTPTKETQIGRGKRKTNVAYISPLKLHPRKRTNSKDINIASVISPVPTKSRRKSSTPRKIHCTTKAFINSESSGHDSPETVTKAKLEAASEASLTVTQDSDTEQLALRWSDDGSQDGKVKDIQSKQLNESDDISKIKEYIDTGIIEAPQNNTTNYIADGSFHADLLCRGFDSETAKIIERDLLDTPPRLENKATAPRLSPKLLVSENIIKESVKHDCVTEIDDTAIENNDLESDDIELSVYECNEESSNYFVFQEMDKAWENVKRQDIKFKDKFSMEVCIDDGIAIRLRATPFSILFDQQPQCIELDDNQRETEMAVNSISNMEKLYTPIKDSVKAQCYEIFDSTLTSLDTPLKMNSPKKTETTVTVMEIMLEEENVDVKDNLDEVELKEKETKKRKRLQSEISSDESATESTNKKTKTDTQYLFNSASIQNIDIESVLKKLHGP